MINKLDAKSMLKTAFKNVLFYTNTKVRSF